MKNWSKSVRQVRHSIIMTTNYEQIAKFFNRGNKLEFDQINYHLGNSPALRILKSDHAPLILGFLNHAFKKSKRLQIPYSELRSNLEKYLAYRETIEPGKHTQSADHYLELWCDENHRFIRRYYELSSDDPVTELTYDAEIAIDWVEDLEKKEFVGTQSRLLSIFDHLESLAENADDSPESRTKLLKSKRSLINNELKKIEETGEVERMEATHIKERFLNILDDFRRLVTDFRLVEDIFKELAGRIKKQKLKNAVTKGEILGQVLDAHDYLEDSDQGKSFEAFWNFLISSDQQEKFNTLINKILSIPEIADLIENQQHQDYEVTLRKMKHQLLAVGQKVLKSKFRLSEELRILLHQNNLKENQRILELSTEIKRFALLSKDTVSRKNFDKLIDLDHLPKIALTMNRPLWQQKKRSSFSKKDVEESSNAGEQDFDAIFNTFFIDEKILKENIENTLKNRSQISLKDLVEIHPIQKGTAEIIAYLEIANRDTRHKLDGVELSKIVFKNTDSTVGSTIEALTPLVIFNKK